MKLSKNKIYNLVKIQKGKVYSTTELLESYGYLQQVQSGLFVQMNLMKMVVNNIEKIIRDELWKVNAMEIGLNQLQSADIWKQTGRYETYGSEMFKLKDRNDKEMVITGTNEELVTLVAKNHIVSYKDLSFTFYQINNKFRDEIRCNTGLIRCKEFSMMDAYSFHTNKEELEIAYAEMRECYKRIFDRLGLKYRIEVADSGEIGGSVSEEFIVETSDGDIEIGHIFQLDTKYSSKLNLQFVDHEDHKQDVVMGCYGIGISRLAQVIADVNRDGNFLNWQSNVYDSVAAYQYAIIVADVRDEKQMELANDLYVEYKNNRGLKVYLDDRAINVGAKLNEADCIGSANKILIGKNIKDGYYEIKQLSNDSWKKIELKTQLS